MLRRVDSGQKISRNETGWTKDFRLLSWVVVVRIRPVVLWRGMKQLMEKPPSAPLLIGLRDDYSGRLSPLDINTLQRLVAG
jgi:hypothetical protein